MDDFQYTFGMTGIDATELFLAGWSFPVASWLMGWIIRQGVKYVNML